MQNLYPEGFVFVNALYGLTWCELAINYDVDSSTKEKAYEEALFAYNQINSETGKSIFDKNLHLPYGAFYRGWKNYLLGKIISFHSVSKADSLEFVNSCEAIGSAITESASPYVESYKLASWPADMFPCLASLKMHDDLFAHHYDTTRQQWIENVKNHLDKSTGLIPQSTNQLTGQTMQGARGS